MKTEGKMLKKPSCPAVPHLFWNFTSLQNLIVLSGIIPAEFGTPEGMTNF
jgi:hypothetical protein